MVGEQGEGLFALSTGDKVSGGDTMYHRPKWLAGERGGSAYCLKPLIVECEKVG